MGDLHNQEVALFFLMYNICKMHFNGFKSACAAYVVSGIFGLICLCYVQNAVSAFTNGANAIDLIGQYTNDDGVTPDYTSGDGNLESDLYGLLSPAGVAMDSVGHRLFVADSSHNRVLVFNLNSSNQLVDKTPDYVLGQSTFYSNLATTTQSGLYNPIGLAYDSANQRLFVADYNNNRVIAYDVASITNGENAVAVLGQANYASSIGTVTQSGMLNPVGLAYDSANQRLFVANRHRVTVYNATSTITNGANAIAVLGQANYTSLGSATTQSGMHTPIGLAYDSANQRLFVANSGNNRVTVYSATSTITNGANAIAVLGQANYTSSGSATTQSGMYNPYDLAYDSYNGRLFVADYANNRVTVYSATSTITNGANAIAVLGQENYTSSNSAITQSSMNYHRAIEYDHSNHRLFVADTDSNRVTIFSVAPLSVELTATESASTDEADADNFPKLLVNGTSTATSTVQLDITGGTATIVTDYASSDPITVTIPPGAYDGTLNTAIAISAPTLVQDPVAETGGETIVFSLVNPDNVIIEDSDSDAVTRSTATYTIIDDDVAVAAAETVPPGSQTAVSAPSMSYAELRTIFGDRAVRTPENSGTPPPYAPSHSLPPVMSAASLGKRSPEIVTIQRILNSDPATRVARSGPGSPGRETSLYGPATRSAVQRFQLKHGIVKSPRDVGYGIVGPKTRAKMNELLTAN